MVFYTLTLKIETVLFGCFKVYLVTAKKTNWKFQASNYAQIHVFLNYNATVGRAGVQNWQFSDPIVPELFVRWCSRAACASHNRCLNSWKICDDSASQLIQLIILTDLVSVAFWIALRDRTRTFCSEFSAASARSTASSSCSCAWRNLAKLAEATCSYSKILPCENWHYPKLSRNHTASSCWCLYSFTLPWSLSINSCIRSRFLFASST